jgi:hypothetical protein
MPPARFRPEENVLPDRRIVALSVDVIKAASDGRRASVGVAVCSPCERGTVKVLGGRSFSRLQESYASRQPSLVVR